MAEVKKNVLTYEGLKRYEEELQDLKVNKRTRSTMRQRMNSAISRRALTSWKIS